MIWPYYAQHPRQGDLFAHIERHVWRAVASVEHKFRIAELAYAGSRDAAVVLKRVKEIEARFAANALEDL